MRFSTCVLSLCAAAAITFMSVPAEAQQASDTKPALLTNDEVSTILNQAEEAAKYYVSIFKNSSIGKVSHYGKEGQEIHGQKPGTVLTIEFFLDGQRLQRSPERLFQGNAGPVATDHNGAFLNRCRHRHPARPGGRDRGCLALADFRAKTASLSGVTAVTSYRQESSAQNSWMRVQASFSASVDVA